MVYVLFFLLIALRHYLDGKKKNALFWVVISVLSHYAMILSVFLMLLIDYFKKKCFIRLLL